MEEEEQREGEGEWRGRKGSPKKERVSGVRELSLHVVVEGMVWIWRGTSSQVRLRCQPC